jgi:hypothetical protein
LSLAAVRDLRVARAPVTAEDLAALQTDVLAGFVLAGFVLARAAAGLPDGTIASDVVMRPAGVPCRLTLGRAGAAGRKVRIDERAPPGAAGTDVLAALLKPVQ